MSDKHEDVPLELSRSERILYDGFLAGATEAQKQLRHDLLWKKSGGLSESEEESANDDPDEELSDTDSSEESDAESSDDDESSRDSDSDEELN